MKRKAAILLCILLALGLSACWNKGVTRDQLKEGVKIRKGKKVFHKAVLA